MYEYTARARALHTNLVVVRWHDLHPPIEQPEGLVEHARARNVVEPAERKE